jgi:two-component system chemotaxis response regulator CheB
MGSSVRALNVLIVDDDPSIRALLRSALSVEEDFGDIREAVNGRDAVWICGEFTPDVILLDNWMPGSDGETTAARIRKLHPNARIVAFSGVIEGKPEWADAFVTKGESEGVDTVIDLARGTATAH